MKKTHLILLWLLIISGCVGSIVHGESFIGLTLFFGLFLFACSLKFYTWYTERKKKNGRKNNL